MAPAYADFKATTGPAMDPSPTLTFLGILTGTAFSNIKSNITPLDVDVAPSIQLAAAHQYIIVCSDIKIVTCIQRGRAVGLLNDLLGSTLLAIADLIVSSWACEKLTDRIYSLKRA